MSESEHWRRNNMKADAQTDNSLTTHELKRTAIIAAELAMLVYFAKPPETAAALHAKGVKISRGKVRRIIERSVSGPVIPDHTASQSISDLAPRLHIWSFATSMMHSLPGFSPFQRGRQGTLAAAEFLVHEAISRRQCK